MRISKFINLLSWFREYASALLLASLLSLVSCTESYDAAAVQDLPLAKWPAKKSYSFPFRVEDADKAYNFYFDVRHDLSYGFCNLFIQYKIFKKEDKLAVVQKREELELLDCQTGQPLGESGLLKFYSTTFYDNHFYLLMNQKFPSSGDYIFEVSHFMRPDTLSGVYSIGYALEKAN